MTQQEELRKFLKSFQEKVERRGIVYYQRKKNLQALLDLEIDPAFRERVLLQELKWEDYYKGPKPDALIKGNEYWEFGKEVKSTEVYIKISLGRKNGPALCMSFHRAERKIIYPFQ